MTARTEKTFEGRHLPASRTSSPHAPGCDGPRGMAGSYLVFLERINTCSEKQLDPKTDNHLSITSPFSPLRPQNTDVKFCVIPQEVLQCSSLCHSSKVRVSGDIKGGCVDICTMKSSYN